MFRQIHLSYEITKKNSCVDSVFVHENFVIYRTGEM